MLLDSQLSGKTANNLSIPFFFVILFTDFHGLYQNRGETTWDDLNKPGDRKKGRGGKAGVTPKKQMKKKNTVGL